MTSGALPKYLHELAHLHRNATKAKGAAPHKPLLLLAILQELDAGRISENLITLTPELVAAFQTNWQALVPKEANWQPRMSYPFRYLKRDGFWELVKDGQPVTIETKYEPSLNQLAALCDGGRFSADLWELLTDSQIRAVLRDQIQNTYFAGTSTPVSEVVTLNYLAIQIDRLKNQAQAKFKVKYVQERKDECYVRNRLFPQVIRDLYNNSCCICHQSASLPKSTLIDGAHIMPFAEFHNDDPRNGLALCKNHHWAFDAGAWSLTDEGRVIVSPKLASSAGFLEANAPIALPKEATCKPDPQALAWHRSHIFQS
ncbi:MAG: HNH endonuclease [Armatimonas sp.]